MKGLWVLLVMVLWPHAGFAADLSGGDIIGKSREAYAALMSYIGVTTVQSSSVLDGRTLTQTASARVTFLSLHYS